MKTKNIKKILLAATVCCGIAATAPLTSFSSWIDEDTSTLITTGDSRDDADAWLTGVYSKWIVDIFCWATSPAYWNSMPTMWLVLTGISALLAQVISKVRAMSPMHCGKGATGLSNVPTLLSVISRL